MPRVSKPLVLSEDELNTLENLKVYGDDEISLRARIVLACAEERTNKSIAEELLVTEMTVRKWKEAYRAKGLKGLESEHAGGRKSSSPTPYDFDNMVLGILDEYTDEKPTAAAIAERLQVDVSKVHYVLRKKGINLSRSRSWEYITRDDMSNWNPPIICLYLCSSYSLIVASSNPWMDKDRQVKGVFVIHDKPLKETLEKSVIPVSLTGVLKTASGLTGNTSSSRVEKPGLIIEKAIQQWDTDKETEFFIFYFGEDFTYEGIRAKQCHFNHFESMDEMKSSFIHWMGGRSNASQHARAESLLEEICTFSQKCHDASQSFLWYLQKNEKEIKAEKQEELSKQNQPDETEKVLILPEAKSWSSVEEMLNELLPEMDSSEPMTEAGAVLFQRDNDGKLQFRLVQSQRKFQAMGEFRFDSKDSFERDMSRLEEDTEAFMQELASANYEMYLEGSKKNKT